MADDWQIGDLALCVALTLNLPGYGNLAPSKILRIGAIYTVNSLRWSVGHDCLALGLAEVKSKGPFGDWHAAAFRKIHPLTDEDRDSFMAELRTSQPIEA